MADELTPEQLEFWDELDVPLPEANAGQTLEQARNFYVHEFQMICELEGLPVPPDEAVWAELRRREQKRAAA